MAMKSDTKTKKPFPGAAAPFTKANNPSVPSAPKKKGSKTKKGGM